MSSTSRAIFLILALAPPLAAQDTAPGDWPVFRGNAAQSGVSSATLPNALGIAWMFKASDGVEGTPAIAGQTVYVGTMDGKLYALDLTSGKKIWHYQGGAIRAAPAVRGGSVYVGDLDGVFHCIDALSGKKQWTVSCGGEIVSSANFFHDNIVFGSNDHHLYCVTAKGEIAWQYKTREKVHGSPAVVGDRILLASCDQRLHIVDAVKGMRVAAFDLGGHVAASVAVHEENAYVGTMANQFLAVDWKKGGTVWNFQAKRAAQPFYASPAITEKLVITGSRDKLVRALDRRTGQEVWTFPTKGRVDSSPVLAGSRVIVGSLDGNLYILDVDTGKELAHFTLGPIAGSSALGNQCVVVGTVRGDIYCLGKAKE